MNISGSKQVDLTVRIDDQLIKVKVNLKTFSMLKESAIPQLLQRKSFESKYITKEILDAYFYIPTGRGDTTKVGLGIKKLQNTIKSGKGVFVDTTLLESVRELLEGKAEPSPYKLFDLYIFVMSALTLDNIYYLPTWDFGDFFAPLESDDEEFMVKLPIDDDVQNFLLRSFMSQHYYIERNIDYDDEEQDKIRQCWADSLLIKPEDLKRHVISSKIIDHWTQSEIPKFLELYSFDRPLVAQKPFNHITYNLYTARAFHNFLIASFLGIPYLPNVMRGPIQSYLEERFAFKRAEIINYLMCYLDLAWKKEVEKVKKEVERFQEIPIYLYKIIFTLPIELTVILAQINNLNQFLQILKKWRRDFKSVRKKGTELPDSATIEEIKKALYFWQNQEKGTIGEKILEAFAKSISETEFSNLDPKSASLAVVLKSIIYSLADQYHGLLGKNIIQRFFRRHYFALNKTWDEAKGIYNIGPHLKRLWNYDVTENDYRYFEQVQKVYFPKKV